MPTQLNDDTSNVSSSRDVPEQGIPITKLIKQEPSDEQYTMRYTDAQAVLISDEIGKITRELGLLTGEESEDEEDGNVEHYIPVEETEVNTVRAHYAQ